MDVVNRSELIRSTTRARDQKIADLQSWRISLLTGDPSQITVDEYQKHQDQVTQLNKDLTTLKSGFSLGEKITPGPDVFPQLLSLLTDIFAQKVEYYQHKTLLPPLTDKLYLCFLDLEPRTEYSQQFRNLWNQLRIHVEAVPSLASPIELPDLIKETQTADNLRQQYLQSRLGREMSLAENDAVDQFRSYDYQLREIITSLETALRDRSRPDWNLVNFQHYFWVEELHALNRAFQHKRQELTTYRLTKQYVLAQPAEPVTPLSAPPVSPFTRAMSKLTCRFLVRSIESGVGGDVSVYRPFFQESYLVNVNKDANDGKKMDLNFYMEMPFEQYLDQAKINLVMPNYEYLLRESTKEKTVDLLRKIHYMVCKTQITVEYCQKFKDQYQLPYEIIYTKHTSPVTSLDQMVDLPERDQIAWLHAAGKSNWKQTDTVLQAWAKHPEWPPLTVTCRKECINNPYLKEGNLETNQLHVIQQIISGITKKHTPVNLANIHVMEYADDLNSLQYQIMNHVCPSIVEGYGHYLNEARAYGCFIVTSDYPPMNELITPNNGFLIHCTQTLPKPKSPDVNLCIISVADFETAMNLAFQIPLEKRQELGQQAQLDYLNDTQFFKQKLTSLLTEIETKLYPSRRKIPILIKTTPQPKMVVKPAPTLVPVPMQPVRKLVVKPKPTTPLVSAPVVPTPVVPTPTLVSTGFNAVTFKQVHDTIVEKKPECTPFTYEIISPVIAALQMNHVENNYGSVRAFLTKQRKDKIPIFLQLRDVGVAETTTASYVSQIYKHVHV